MIKTVVIIGSGTMGSGIAQVSANAGYKTILFDINESALLKAEKGIDKNLSVAVEKGKLSQADFQRTKENLTFTSDFNHLKGDLIIEAIIEKPEPKIELFNKLSELNGPDCIYATNTSSIPITQISAACKYPEQIIGIHFFNPAHLMKLVEIIQGAHTKIELIEICKSWVLSLQKVPVLAADAPGFIVNRVARHYYVEALKLLEEGVADLETIDKILESSGFKMGPFRLMDLIGVDTNFSVTSSMYKLFHYDSKFRPSRIQEQKVLAGHHGKKTGKGFYDYTL